MRALGLSTSDVPLSSCLVESQTQQKQTMVLLNTWIHWMRSCTWDCQKKGIIHITYSVISWNKLLLSKCSLSVFFLEVDFVAQRLSLFGGSPWPLHLGIPDSNFSCCLADSRSIPTCSSSRSAYNFDLGASLSATRQASGSVVGFHLGGFPGCYLIESDES